MAVFIEGGSANEPTSLSDNHPSSGRLEAADLTPPEWKAVTERGIVQIRAKGTCDVFEKEYIRKDGSRLPVLVTGAAGALTT